MEEEHVPTPHDSLVHSVHSPRHDEGRIQQQELTELVTKLTERVTILRERFTSDKAGLYKSIYQAHSQSQEAGKEGQGFTRKEEDKDKSAKKRRNSKAVYTYTRRRRRDSTGSGDVSTASREVSTSGAVSTAGVQRKDKGKAVMEEPAIIPKKLKKRI
ncbi:hypothetical protein Tco_1190601 [Tanacetum coccineum]